MAEAPIMPFATDAFIADTTALDDAETGAYMLLLVDLWRSETGTLPLDHKKLARTARCPASDWPDRWEAIKGYFIIENGTIRQGRVTRDRAIVRAKIEKARANGKKGGRPKATETQEEKAAGSNPVNLEETKPEPTKKLSINHEPDPIDSEANASGGQAALIPASDPAKQLFDTGVAFMIRKGVAEKQARSVIGKLRSRLGGSNDEALWFVQQAIAQDVTEPVAYFEAMLRGGKQPARSDLMNLFLGEIGEPAH